MSKNVIEHPYHHILTYIVIDDNNKELALAKVVKRGAKSDAQVRQIEYFSKPKSNKLT